MVSCDMSKNRKVKVSLKFSGNLMFLCKPQRIYNLIKFHGGLKKSYLL